MNILLAETTIAGASGTTAAGTSSGGDIWSSLTMFGLLAVVMIAMYFFTIRPQRKREKELKKQVDAMAVGDSVVTIGGVVGTVANILDDNITITTSVAHTMLTFKKSAISTIGKREKSE
jgi:preprotein translocase subunit YajC